jgi:glycosyltransferase involved in cell wall biosynthesis
MKIIFSSNISWSIYNFRTPLLKSLQKDGHEIYTVSYKDKYAEKLVNEGFSFKEIYLNNNSTNPFEDLKTIYKYYKIYKEINPDLICHNAIKPNIYGTIAAGILGIPVVNNISGLGTLFIKSSFSTFIAKALYKISQIKATKVFFQNNDDLKLFVKNRLVNKSKCSVIPGSGVNTSRFMPLPQNNLTNNFQFLFIGRLLYDKGIREYVSAAKNLKLKYHEVTFNILGPLYENNSSAVSQQTLNLWIKQVIIKYLGQADKVEEYMQSVHCVVLPSYREGLSKVLIEASSMALPIVTTNVPGCKDVVLDNITGFLCQVKSSIDLERKMEKMLLLSTKKRIQMGEKARKRAINFFDDKLIIKQYKETIYSIVSS